MRQAIGNGDLDYLPGKGIPLQLEDLSMVPPELRMSYKI
ncbi:DnaJ family domain-containing protein [Salmonella enterica]